MEIKNINALPDVHISSNSSLAVLCSESHSIWKNLIDDLLEDPNFSFIKIALTIDSDVQLVCDLWLGKQFISSSSMIGKALLALHFKTKLRA